MKTSKNKRLTLSIKFAFKLCSYAKALTIWMIFLVLSNTILMYTVPAFSRKVVDNFLTFNSKPTNFNLLIIYGILLIVKVVFSNLERYIAIKQGEKINNRFRNNILNHVLSKNIINFNKHPYGEVETVMTSCIDNINDSIYCFIETLLIYPIGLAIGITLIFNISYKLIILIALQLLVNYFIMSRGSMLQAKVSEENYKCQGKYFTLLSTLYNSYENIRLLFIKRNTMFKHKVESKTFSKSNIKMAKVNFINITMAQDISEAVFNIFTIYLFYIFVKNGTSTIGAYMAFIPIKEAITGAINGFIKLKINKKSFEVAYNQINEIITIEQYLKSNTTENTNTQISYIENINFSNLDFTYPTSEKQYKLNYKFEKNNCYLILGKNGIGKSTMIKLLSGILPCDNNKILINNSPLKLNNEQFNCDKISILPQNIKMFEKSIIDLIINEDIIINKQISTKFNVNNIISSIIDSSFDSMSNNIDISQLSGGEKKKILLSLIFSSNTDLIILDEPFAELDNNAKQVLVELINTYIKNKIIIIITHEIPKEFDNIDTTAIQMIDEDNIITLKTQDKLECKC